MAAPGENVLRASIPRGRGPGGDKVGQGQGTSFAVALTAGAAALWLAHHGRANLVAAARSRDETLQAMFRRLVRASAMRPETWNSFEMGAGIVDARALLNADLDAERDRETVPPPADPREREAVSIRSFIAESAGHAAVPDDHLDLHRYGPELGHVLLQSRIDEIAQDEIVPEGTPRPEALSAPPAPPPVSVRLAEAVHNAGLRDRLMLDAGDVSNLDDGEQTS